MHGTRLYPQQHRLIQERFSSAMEYEMDLPLIERVTHQFRRDAFLLMARLLAE